MGALKDALRHPDELLPMAALYLSSQRVKRLPKNPDLAFCYDSLNRVSRSFAVVIAQLPPALRDGVCVFYLVLRALDTIEDDMSIPVAEKVPLLRSFHARIGDESYSSSYGAGHYRVLMQRFGHVARVYATLEPEARDVIEEMCARMGAGMADFAETEVETVAQYDLYCHYVAGLVGMGLSRLFVHLGGEHPSLSSADELSNHMALFLQKTNIIRDYLEDITEEPRPRMFWPREVWGCFAKELADFARPQHRRHAVHCLNALVLDALRHVPFCLHYLSLLRDPAIFRFCAIPQVMAAGTLARCLNNPRVFEGVVKMRRGETAKVMHSLCAEEDALLAFRGYLAQMARTARAAETDDPSREPLLIATVEALAGLDARRAELASRQAEAERVYRTRPLSARSRATVLAVALIYLLVATHPDSVRGLAGIAPNPGAAPFDRLNRLAAGLFVGYALYVFLAGHRP